MTRSFADRTQNVPPAEHTRRQIAIRLLPFVFLLYIINYLDRTSVAYAAIGMARDLGFNDRVLGLGIGIFFLSYLSHWFIQEDRAKATSNFMAAIPVSLIIGSPVAGWILGRNWFMIEGWRWLFFLEGIPAILLGAVAFFFLTDWPPQARWLTAEQRQWISRTLEQEKPLSRQSISIGQALRSRTVLLLATA